MTRRLAILALLIACLAQGAMAAEQWGDAYQKGLAAAEKNDWATTRAMMQKAIAEKPAEANPARYRNVTLVYVPHFWLGISLFQTGDVDGALGEFGISQSQGVVQNTRYYSDLRSWVARAQGEKEKRARDAASGSRKAADTAIQNATFSQANAIAAGGDRSTEFQQGKRLMEDAMGMYDQAGTDQASYRKVAEKADQARKLFDAAAAAKTAVKPAPRPTPPKPPSTDTAASAAAKAAEEQRQKELKDARAAASQKVADLRGKLASAEKSFPNDAGIQSWLQGAEAEADQWSAVLPTLNDAAEIDKIGQSAASRSEQLNQKAAAARAAAIQPGPVPMPTDTSAESRTQIRSELRKAWVSFANGNAGACESITSQLINSRRGTEEAYVLRGVARYTEAMTSNKEELLDKAAADFAAALKLNPRVKVDKRYFSPKLIAFFDEIRGKR